MKWLTLPLCLGLVLVTNPIAAPADPAPKPVTIKVAEGKHIDFLAGEELVGRFHIDPSLPKPHFHPLMGPFGKPVTRGFPMIPDDPNETKDHKHHRGVWFGHQEVTPEGIELKRNGTPIKTADFWSEGDKVVCVEVGKPQQDKNHAWIQIRNECRCGDQKVMDETHVIHLYDFGHTRLFVFDVDLHASVAPITFGDNKDGWLGVRVAETMCEKKRVGGVLENAEGKRTEGASRNADQKGCWGLLSAWCDYSGPVEGKVAGVTLMDDPKNPYPAYWHARGYGLMSANPFGRTKAGFPAAKGKTDLVKMAKGEHLKFRYGMLIHPRDAKEGKVADFYQQFVKLRG